MIEKSIAPVLALAMLGFVSCKEKVNMPPEGMIDPVLTTSLCSTCHPLEAIRLNRLLDHENEVTCQQCHGDSTQHRLFEGEVIPSSLSGRDDKAVALLKTRVPNGVDPIKFHYITFPEFKPATPTVASASPTAISNPPASPTEKTSDKK